jgi:isopenicillin-N N-acyltransferase-like protein
MWRTRWLLSLVLLVVLVPALSAAEPFRFPEKKHGKGQLRYLNDLPVLIVRGSPEEIGEQMAVLAVKPGEKILNYPKDMLERFRLPVGWQLFATAGAGMLAQFPADHRKELEAMAKTGIDRESLIVGNTLFDIKKSFACSALHVTADRSKTGGPLFGRNLDYPPLGYAHHYSLVTIYRPAGKHAFAAIGFPGLVGCISGMNDAGLALGVLEIYSVKRGVERFDPKGTPYALCYRRILEECSTIAEAEKLLRSLKRTTTTCLAICDRDRVAVFEITPKELVVREPMDGLCSCTNHFCSKELKPASETRMFRSLERFKELEKARDLKKLSVEDVHRRMHAASNRYTTMHTMVFEPRTLKLHLAIGRIPASAGELKTLELKPLFEK